MQQRRALTEMEGEQARMVYVVDDEASVRMSLVFLLEANGLLPWPFASGLDLLESLPVLQPGCLLLDVRMPQIDGLQLMAALVRERCGWPVIVITGHGDVAMAVQAMKLGAIDVIEKPFDEAVLLKAIDAGFARLDEAERRRLACASADRRIAALSPREKDVLGGLMSGQQNKSVAYQLGLSVRTVEMHRANLFSKLGVRTVQEASSIFASAQVRAT